MVVVLRHVFVAALRMWMELFCCLIRFILLVLSLMNGSMRWAQLFEMYALYFFVQNLCNVLALYLIVCAIVFIIKAYGFVVSDLSCVNQNIILLN